LAFCSDWYSSKSAMICGIMTCVGSAPISWVIEIRGLDGQAFPLPSKTHLLPGTLRSVLRPPDSSPSRADRQIEAEASALAIAAAMYARRAAMAPGALKLLGFLGQRQPVQVGVGQNCQTKTTISPRRRRRLYLPVRDCQCFLPSACPFLALRDTPARRYSLNVKSVHYGAAGRSIFPVA